MQAMQEAFPKIVVQFEDFSSEAAFFYLDRYASKYPMFNDDIQGTGAVILGGYITAAVQASEASGRELSDQKIGEPLVHLLGLCSKDNRLIQSLHPQSSSALAPLLSESPNN
jgi:hypothetical protein